MQIVTACFVPGSMLGWKALAAASLDADVKECEDIEEAEAVRDASDSESDESSSIPLSAQTSDDSWLECKRRSFIVYAVS